MYYVLVKHNSPGFSFYGPMDKEKAEVSCFIVSVIGGYKPILLKEVSK